MSPLKYSRYCTLAYADDEGFDLVVGKRFHRQICWLPDGPVKKQSMDERKDYHGDDRNRTRRIGHRSMQDWDRMWKDMMDHQSRFEQERGLDIQAV